MGMDVSGRSLQRSDGRDAQFVRPDEFHSQGWLRRRAVSGGQMFMLNLQLRDEFRGERLKGTTVDFSSDKQTSALKRSAADFLNITYPSVDLLRVLEATQPDKSRPV